MTFRYLLCKNYKIWSKSMNLGKSFLYFILAQSNSWMQNLEICFSTFEIDIGKVKLM